MKKFLGILVLGLLVCNTGFAKEHTYDDQLRIMEDQVLQILKLSDSAKVMLHFSNEGAMMVTVESGLGKYQYIIPAQAQ